MEKYISKSALVAEIEKIRKALNMNLRHDQGVCDGLYAIQKSIDTLEVKDVDLKKEFDDYTKDIVACDVQFEPFTHLYNCAKHFFELGMTISNPITAADRGMSEEIIINLKRIEKDYRINLTKEIEWLRNKVKKGEKV